MGRVGFWGMTTALAAALAGCAVPTRYAPEGHSDKLISFPVKWKSVDGRDGHNFIALALSGGGTKAAVFAGESMFYLDAVGLLHQASMISSVSGGSFAAAYYALSCDKEDAVVDPARVDPARCGTNSGQPRPVWTYEQSMKTLKTGFRPMLWRAALSAVTPTVASPVTADQFAAYIDRAYLHEGRDGGRPFTFGDLDQTNRPSLVLNSTLLSNHRQLFETTDTTNKPQGYLRRRTADEFFHFAFTDYFFDKIRVNLAQTPLGFGVAASGAFPALIDYPVLRNYAYCDRQQDKHKDKQACLNDKTNLLTLTDGGANDNQGLIEIEATIAEIAEGEARSEYSAPHSPLASKLDKMQTGDRGLILIINSSLTEATGLDTPEEHDFLFGILGRVSAGVDVYSATAFNLRKRLYTTNLQVLNDVALKGRDISVSADEIGLVTLNMYPTGGAEATFLKDAGVPPSDGDPGQTATIKPQQKAFGYVASHMDKLKLGNVHPQCLFEQSKLVETGMFSLASIDGPKSTCLRHAARWATALRMEEICRAQKQAGGGKARLLNGQTTIRCEGGDLAAPASDRLGPLEDCVMPDNEDERQAVLRNLVSNTAFMRTFKTTVQERAQAAVKDGAPSGNSSDALKEICRMPN